MRSRWFVCVGSSVLLVACVNGGSTPASEGSESTGTVDPGTTDATSSTPVTDTTGATEGDPSDDGSTSGEPTTGVDSSTGPAPGCGNGVKEADEACDGDNLDEAECTTFGFMSGPLACASDCSGFDTSACVEYPARCGDGEVEDDEVCDDGDLVGQTCATQGFDAGTLACGRDCTAFDTSGCTSCGNVIVEAGEACDGVALLGQDCLTQGFEHGEIACAADCLGFDTSGCGLCGDGSQGGEESCDGPDLGGASCMSLGLGEGNLACLPTCLYDFADCEIPGSEVVDFPTAADPRFTASGTNPWNAGDWFEGVRMTTVPSIGQVDVHLELVGNGLTPCGFQEAEVSINGVALGTFTVVQNDTVIDQSFPVVPAIAGPAYTIRYETTTTVAGGCGSAGYDQVGSTVTFHAG